MRLPRRRTLWLSAALVALISGWLFLPRSRITGKNYDLVREGMTEEEVIEILGEGKPGPGSGSIQLQKLGVGQLCWDSGPNRIDIDFKAGRVMYKYFHTRTSWQILQWYAKKGAAKIGVNWN